jgi:feruloyl esterase
LVFLASFPGPIGVYDAHFKFVVFADSQWSYKRLDFDADVARADRLDNNTINATDPDLRPFVERGGKLLLYHGWNDVIIAPRSTITYYDNVRRTVGPVQTDKSVRLFMAPGMAHCDGGEGPSEFDALAALEGWVERGMAPENITASQSKEGKVVRTRPLCVYPRRAKYVGAGSTDDAKNFRCVAP